jgi:hypothetical protein
MNDVDDVSRTTDPAPADELLSRALSISTGRIACCADAIERDPTPLANEVRVNWGESDWVSLLETRHDHDRELHAAWVPLNTEAELWAASLVDDDVALATGDYSGRPLPAPGRDNPEWPDLALQSMIANLEERGRELSLEHYRGEAR